MSKRLRRPSPALVISLIALFVALGGTVYAAGKINGSSVKKNSLPGNRVKTGTLPGNRLQANGVTGAQVDESSLSQVPNAKNADAAKSADTAKTAVTADNATKVNGHTAACLPGQTPFAGACWETAARAAETAPNAAATCTDVGGTLPDTMSLRAFALNSGITLAATYEWTSSVTVSGTNIYTVATVAPNGDVNFTANSDTKGFRCVHPLVQ